MFRFFCLVLVLSTVRVFAEMPPKPASHEPAPPVPGHATAEELRVYDAMRAHQRALSTATAIDCTNREALREQGRRMAMARILRETPPLSTDERAQLQQRANALVRQLYSRSFPEREAATEALRGLGYRLLLLDQLQLHQATIDPATGAVSPEATRRLYPLLQGIENGYWPTVIDPAHVITQYLSSPTGPYLALARDYWEAARPLAERQAKLERLGALRLALRRAQRGDPNWATQFAEFDALTEELGEYAEGAYSLDGELARLDYFASTMLLGPARRHGASDFGKTVMGKDCDRMTFASLSRMLVALGRPAPAAGTPVLVCGSWLNRGKEFPQGIWLNPGVFPQLTFDALYIDGHRVAGLHDR